MKDAGRRMKDQTKGRMKGGKEHGEAAGHDTECARNHKEYVLAVKMGLLFPTALQLRLRQRCSREFL
jgi:hypothetical protein